MTFSHGSHKVKRLPSIRFESCLNKPAFPREPSNRRRVSSSLSPRLRLVSSSNALSPREFAVLAFLLQKVQQGVSLPRHLPLPLRSLLPAPQPVSVWTMTPKALTEAQASWSRAAKGASEVSVEVLRRTLTGVVKNKATVRQMWGWLGSGT